MDQPDRADENWLVARFACCFHRRSDGGGLTAIQPNCSFAQVGKQSGCFPCHGVKISRVAKQRQGTVLGLIRGALSLQNRTDLNISKRRERRVFLFCSFVTFCEKSDYQRPPQAAGAGLEATPSFCGIEPHATYCHQPSVCFRSSIQTEAHRFVKTSRTIVRGQNPKCNRLVILSASRRRAPSQSARPIPFRQCCGRM